MPYPPTSDPAYQNTVQKWLEQSGEVVALFRYPNAAGARTFEFFEDGQTWLNRLGSVAPGTCVSVWQGKQIPLRGQVDAAFVAQALQQIPEGEHFVVVGLEKAIYGRAWWYPYREGESHQELQAELEEFAGQKVAVGLYPDWSENGGDEVSAVVAAPDGSIPSAAY